MIVQNDSMLTIFDATDLRHSLHDKEYLMISSDQEQNASTVCSPFAVEKRLCKTMQMCTVYMMTIFIQERYWLV